MKDHEELRLRCLEIARTVSDDPDQIILYARTLYEFVVFNMIDEFVVFNMIEEE
jgi:hypothetical protein